MKFGLLCIVIAVLEKARAALSPAGEHVCLVDEKYVAVVQVRELIPVTVYKVEWCWKIPPRCTVESQSFKPILINKHIPRVRIVPKCCHGYKEVPEESRCVAHCSEPCIHGACIHPETCSCVSGYHGSRCDKPCEPGTWGRRCMEKCDCSGNGECEGVNGICTCSPGWRGYRCELPCDPGRYGKNCEGRCNCDGELCNHVSGECEAITDTTLATDDNATTTEGTVFETTTEEIAGETGYTETVTEYAIPDVTVPTEVYEEYTDETALVSDNVTIEMILEVDNTTLIIDEVVEREPDEVRIYVQPETPILKESSPFNETDADNEVDNEIDYNADVQKTNFNLLDLLENLSIVCGVFVLIIVLTMCAVLISHHRKMKKVGIDCHKDSNMNSQDFVIHRFYGGGITPAKTILDHQVTATNLDFDVELPKLMTFKPLPDEKSDREYFMSEKELQKDNLDVAKENPLGETIFNDDYNNRLAQFEYDVPKSITFLPARLKYEIGHFTFSTIFMATAQPVRSDLPIIILRRVTAS